MTVKAQSSVPLISGHLLCCMLSAISSFTIANLMKQCTCMKFHFNLEERASEAVAYPGIFFLGGGSTNSVEDRGQRERGSGGGSPLVRGSGGSCNLVQEISFHIVKFS